MSVYCTCLSLLLAQLCVLRAARSAETSSHGGVFRSDYTYSQQAAGWLKLHRESVEWETARIKCHNEGAVLASPVDANMATALTQLLTQEELPNTEFFSGVSSPLRDGVYTSIEGIALNQLYGQWDIGQPNNWGGHQHCITFIHYKYSEMLNINDEICTNKFPFICYRPAAAPYKLTAYKTVDKETPRGKEPCSDYTFSMEAAGWLKLHREEVNWQTAQLQCHHEGAVLASPLNADLAKALTKLLTQAELENSTKVFAGVLSVLADGVFTSIEGVALDQLYTKWNIGQPNRGIRQDCTTFSYYNDRDVMPINDEDCFETYPYICYRPASVSDNMTKCGTADKVSETRRDGNEFRSDYTFSQEAAGWLKLHRLPLDWQTAKLQCYHEGAVLASPLNADLSTAMTMLLTQANLKNYTEFFSGVSSALEDGVFTSIEGVALDQLYTQWDLGQPNFVDRNQHCITYFYYKDRDVLPINDETCSHMFPYICYRPASASDKLTECGTVDTEYKLDARTRHCYKFHRYAMKWPSAARVCQAEGGYLAVIDSQPEADLLVELFAAYPKETLLYISEDGHYSASIGFSKRSGKWWTVQGKPLEESGYHIWNKGEPNNALGKQQCGGLLRNGRLDDAYCDMAYPFICEKSPDSLLTTMGNFDESVY